MFYYEICNKIGIFTTKLTYLLFYRTKDSVMFDYNMGIDRTYLQHKCEKIAFYY